MKLSIQQKTLKTELGFITMVAKKPKKESALIPILQCVLLETVSGNLRLTATDLDTAIIIDAVADISSDGKCIVNARAMKDIISVCGDNISFELQDRKLVIESGKAKWSIDAITDIGQFPELVAMPSKPLMMPFSVLQAAVNQTKFAITKEQSRFTLSGAKLLISDNNLKMVTTDGHRLALCESNSIKTGKKSLDVLLSQSALGLIEKMPKSAATVTVDENDSHFFLSSNSKTIISRKMSGSFPNYELVLPKDNSKFVKVDIVALTEALKQSSTVRQYNSSMRLTFGGDGIATISAVGDEQSFESSIVYSGETQDLTVGFNINYLLDYCKLIKSGVCEIGMKDSNAQVVFEAVNQETGKRFRYVVMPLRV